MSASLYFVDRNRMETVQLSSGPQQFPAQVDLPGERLNMTNSNTGAVVSALGLFYGEDGTDEIQIRELWAACARFLDSEIAEVVDGGIAPSQPSPNFVFCGRREGYLTEKISRIKQDCEAAMALNATHAYLA